MEFIDTAYKAHDTRQNCFSLLSEKEVLPTIAKKISGRSRVMSLIVGVYNHEDVHKPLDVINKIKMVNQPCLWMQSYF